VTLSVTSGPATISGNTVTITGGGTVSIKAKQAGNGNYAAAPPVTQSFSVAKAGQAITFGALSNQTYGAAPFTLSATASSGLAVTFSVTSGPATVSGNTVTLTGAGSVTVKATQGGNGSYLAAPAVSQSFTVAPNQAITFGALPGQTYGVAPFVISASASSGLPVSFSVTSGPATVSGSTVTVTGAGTVKIQATQAGDASYSAAAPVTQSFSVAKAGQAITFGTLSNQTYGAAPFTLSASASSGLPVSFSVTSGPAAISGSTVTITGTGSVTIKATQTGNGNYLAAPAVSQSFTVAPNQAITFGALPGQTYGVAPFGISASASSGLPVSFAVTSGPATVSGSTVTITGAGTVKIQATQAGDASYSAAAPVTQSFSVAKAGQAITFGTLPNQTYGVSPFAISATASSGLAVTFSVTSGPATISGNTVTITGRGTVKIKATQTGNPDYLAAPPVTQSFSVN
jgi:hypothetical protein